MGLGASELFVIVLFVGFLVAVVMVVVQQGRARQAREEAFAREGWTYRPARRGYELRVGRPCPGRCG